MNTVPYKIKKTRELLVEHFPDCFCLPRTPKRPLKVGIKHDIKKQLPELNSWILGKTLEDYVSGPSYQAMLIEGASRYDLSGHPAGTVSPEEALRAKKRMQALSPETQALWASLVCNTELERQDGKA